MKKICYILCVTVFFTACSKGDVFENTNGTKLITIDFNDSNKAIDSWVISFSYNEQGAINKIEELYAFGNRYEIEYNEGILQEYKTFNINVDRVAARDSVAYNQNGTIRAIYNFTADLTEDLVLTRIFEFEYSNQNRISEKKSYSVNKGEFESTERYFWNNKNIESSQYYDSNEKLSYEIFYKYDNQINYKKNIPIYISDPINQTTNNITWHGFNDYTGAIDLSCYSCETEYSYNRDGYPTSIRYDWGTQLRLRYE